MEHPIMIDDNEMAEFISEKLLTQGIIVKTEDILKVLDLEIDFLKLKGVIQED